jgi:hydrogenase maturation protease
LIDQKQFESEFQRRILILGMGNILLSDEGVGVRAIEYLEKQKLPDRVDLLDGGTGGFTLLSEIQKYSKVILIDATLDEHPVGTIRVIKPKFARDFPKAMSTHEIGLKDLIESASILGTLPDIFLMVVSINNVQPMNINLSEEVSRVLPKIKKTVLEIVEEMEL